MGKLPTVAADFISQIYFIRGQRIMLDADLATVYGVSTKRLNEQVKRNPERFPAEFMFQLTKEEYEDLRSQIATSSWGGRRSLPFAFNEHGAVMAASVLNSTEAVQASIFVVKAFIQMRNLAGMYKELEKKLLQLEGQFVDQDEKIRGILQVIRQFLPIVKERKPIGYKRKNQQ